MSTKLPRVMVTLDPPLHRWVGREASKQGLSVSMTVRDLLRAARDDFEDAYWAREGAARWSTLNRRRLVTHEAVKRRLRLD